MSDEPYSFGPTDSGAGCTPDSRPGPALPTGSAPYYGPPPATGAPPEGTIPADELRTGAAVEPAPWGAAAPVDGRKRMSTVAKSLTAVGVAALIAVGGTVAVTSANADNAPSSASSGMQPVGGEGAGTNGGTASGTTGTHGGANGTGRSGGFGGGMASRSLVAGALHGEFVVADGTGTVTERLQTGAVTSVSSTSLTVQSTDDFTASYTVPSGTDVSALAAGTAVTVIARVDGSTLTVVSIAATRTGAGPGSTGTGAGTGTGTGNGTGSTSDDSGV